MYEMIARERENGKSVSSQQLGRTTPMPTERRRDEAAGADYIVPRFLRSEKNTMDEWERFKELFYSNT